MASALQSSRPRRFATLVVFALVAFGIGAALTLHSGVVARAGSCYSSSCIGGDPNQTGCNDSSAYTVSYAAVGQPSGTRVGWVYEIYSPNCASNWTFSRANSTMRIITVTAVNCSDYSCRGQYNYQYANWYNTTYGWSPMVDGIPIAYSCADYVVPYSNDAHGCASPV